MTNLQEVPTDELLSFQDYPSVHSNVGGNNTTIPISEAQITISNLDGSFQKYPNLEGTGDGPNDRNTDVPATKSFWSFEYYQTFFDVDTKDVVDRIFASITPKWDNSLKRHLRTKPDLYGPLWISVTLIFTIAISSNVANYLQHAKTQYHWKYDFHLVSYAATAICSYITLVPFLLWGLLKWTSQTNDLETLEGDVTTGALELICIYGYSLFIYIPVSILWTIQINVLQWALVLLATFISGSVLLLTLMPALKLSKYKLLLTVGILFCHLLLAASFKLYFFHDPTASSVVSDATITTIKSIVSESNKTKAV